MTGLGDFIINPCDYSTCISRLAGLEPAAYGLEISGPGSKTLPVVELLLLRYKSCAPVTRLDLGPTDSGIGKELFVHHWGFH
jgi:hypothetical protein